MKRKANTKTNYRTKFERTKPEKYKREEGILMGKIYVIIVVLVLAAICGIYLLKTYKH